MKRIVIIGAGGHARVIAETIELLEGLQVVGFIDDQLEKGTHIQDGIEVIGSRDELARISAECNAFVIGIGNNDIRKQIAQNSDCTFETIIHPRATVSKSAVIESGSVVLAGAVINSNSLIGAHCIVNSNVVVDHDCSINSFVHLSIGTLVGSNSTVSSLFKTEIGQAIPAFSTY